MCTLSWLTDEKGYQVFFNRDEQRTRPKAIPPRLQQYNAIYPVDSLAGGTWIALSQLGSVFCLLNNYQCKNRQTKGEDLISRGTVIPALLAAEQDHQHFDLALALAQLPLAQMAPFFLCYFPPKTTSNSEQSIQLSTWDGKTLRQSQPKSPLISSGFALAKVSQNRLSYYPQCDPTIESLNAFHRSHQPQRSAYSVCMHRPDAHTVSFTHISVAEQSVMRYTDGAPCASSATAAIYLPS